ncbi:GNAT family N-acetyltransferase [Corynebacterium lubricantis]|uniref:GNAT family N-acetyltransferase n=1 Tax=Corynebacterium lubricantis TaxID=541095 RepID=UPI0003811F6A|nr:GNAT family N-acetyltransferase [Corynebacterium lubricantis]
MPDHSAITYRPYSPADAPAIRTLINDAFGVRRRFQEPALTALLSMDLEQSLYDATFTRVATRNNEVVGIIIGKIQGEEKLDARLKRAGAIATNIAQALPYLFAQRTGVRDWFREQRSYARAAKMSRNRNTQLNNEIILFIVDSSTRGQGVGKRLFNDYLAELRRHKLSDFFLYTDSECTWQFYEARGMRRVGVSSYASLIDDSPREIESYVYAGSV